MAVLSSVDTDVPNKFFKITVKYPLLKKQINDLLLDTVSAETFESDYIDPLEDLTTSSFFIELDPGEHVDLKAQEYLLRYQLPIFQRKIKEKILKKYLDRFNETAHLLIELDIVTKETIDRHGHNYLINIIVTIDNIKKFYQIKNITEESPCYGCRHDRPSQIDHMGKDGCIDQGL